MQLKPIVAAVRWACWYIGQQWNQQQAKEKK